METAVSRPADRAKPDPGRRTTWLLTGMAAVHFALHVATNGNYGVFRDELYYLACAENPAWGYVDHPPLSILVLAAWKSVFGVSVHAIRILPALAGAATVLLAGAMAREMGGGRFAQLTAAGCVMISPVYLVNTGFYSMNALELVAFGLIFYWLIRLVNTGNRRLWLAIGVVFGLGLLNKISVGVLGSGLFVGLWFTPLRTHLYCLSIRGRKNTVLRGKP